MFIEIPCKGIDGVTVNTNTITHLIDQNEGEVIVMLVSGQELELDTEQMSKAQLMTALGS